MAALSALRTDLQKRFQDSSGNFLSATPANQFINNAVEDFVNQTEPLWREYGWYVTAKQQRYDLPSDHMKLKTLTWYQNGRFNVDYIPPKEFQLRGYLDKDTSRANPEYFTIVDNDIYLGPAPSTTSNTTTMNDAGGISATDTSVITTDGTKFQSPGGLILIESEQIAYQNLATNTLSLLLRAQGGTAAATHADGTTIKRMDLVAVYHYTAPTLSADADVPAIDTRWHRMVLHHALASALKMGGRDEAATIEMQYYEKKVLDAKREIRRVQRDRLTFLRNVY